MLVGYSSSSEEEETGGEAAAIDQSKRLSRKFQEEDCGEKYATAKKQKVKEPATTRYVIRQAFEVTIYRAVK